MKKSAFAFNTLYCITSITIPMKHDDVVAALKIISEKGMAINISKTDLQDLKTYNLIEIGKGEENDRSPGCTLTKKGRVMLKANSKPKAE